MKPVEKRPEPNDFQERVAKKGQKFLNQNPNPSASEWRNRSYWREVLPDLWHAYRGVCAYSCQYIPYIADRSVDHFIPKSIAPEKAYDWDNFRLATVKMNSRKGNATDVVDPFIINEGTFHLLFPQMLIRPNSDLPTEVKDQVLRTIERLKLNSDDAMVKYRLQWVLDYCDSHISFPFLSQKVPFVAFEIERQNIHNQLPNMFRRRRIKL